MNSDLIEAGKRRREAILGFLREYTREHGYAPTHREIMEAVDLASPNAVREHLATLHNEGHVIVTPGVSRGIRVL